MNFTNSKPAHVVDGLAGLLDALSKSSKPAFVLIGPEGKVWSAHTFQELVQLCAPTYHPFLRQQPPPVLDSSFRLDFQATVRDPHGPPDIAGS